MTHKCLKCNNIGPFLQVVSLASYYQIAGLERAVAEVEEELLEQLFTDTLQKELDEKDETMELFETLSVGTIETDIDTDSIATEEDQEEKEWETYEDLVSEEEVKEWGTNRDLDMTSKAAEAAEETEGEECGNCGCEACRDGQVGVRAPTQPTHPPPGHLQHPGARGETGLPGLPVLWLRPPIPGLLAGSAASKKPSTDTSHHTHTHLTGAPH